MQTALLVLIGIVIVAASFGLTLSILDHGITATVLEVVRVSRVPFGAAIVGGEDAVVQRTGQHGAISAVVG